MVAKLLYFITIIMQRWRIKTSLIQEGIADYDNGIKYTLIQRPVVVEASK